MFSIVSKKKNYRNKMKLENIIPKVEGMIRSSISKYHSNQLQQIVHLYNVICNFYNETMRNQSIRCEKY